METLPITLIVKAPNQQIEDQTIKCELSWTINKLKQHLSEVYPSKPPKHEQKLIYSGQLLSDSLVLKDVLRQYEGQETHTVHLVCTTKQMKTMPSSAQTTSAATVTAQPTQTTATAPNMVNWGTPGTPIDPNQYAMHLAWMQQTYLQYMTQYMQLAANSYGLPPQQLPQTVQQQQAPNPVPEANGAMPGQQAVGAEPIRNENNPNLQPERDWLDVFYLLSRIMVLFSVVYFYSSPLRFIFVLVLGFIFYLYQIGFFRNINNNNNNNTSVPPTEPLVQEQETPPPSRLMVVWTFFATFFASLIPEIPNAV